MRRIAHLGLTWGDRYGQPPKTDEQKHRDTMRVEEILRRLDRHELFQTGQHYYDFDLEIGSNQFDLYVQELQTDLHLVPDHITVAHQYSDAELESAELLRWYVSNHAIEDDYYDRNEDAYQGGPKASRRRCVHCRAPLEQTRDLVLDKRKMRKRDLSATYSLDTIISERIRQLFIEQGVTGIQTRSVTHFGKPFPGEVDLFQVVITHTFPRLAVPPTQYETETSCDTCGRFSRFLMHQHRWGKIPYTEETSMYYPRSILGHVQDINQTSEWFGELAVSRPYIVITQRFRHLLLNHKVTDWVAEPVLLVD